MKKALVLGVLAFFAINIASVQSVSAQDRKAAPTSTVKKEAKPAGVKKEAKQINDIFKELDIESIVDKVKKPSWEEVKKEHNPE